MYHNRCNRHRDANRNAMATIKDVAKIAGVSVASVSRYLNAPDLVRNATRARIAQAIERLNYKPSALAVSMRTRQTQNIALVVQAITNMYYIDLYGFIRAAADRHAYSVSLFTTDRNETELRKTIDNILRNNYAGVVLGFLDEPGVQRDLDKLNQKLPLVLITCDPSQSAIDNIHLDARYGIARATRHLVDLGRKRISYVGAAPNSVISTEKYTGYASALEKAGQPIDAKLIRHGARQHFSTGMEATAEFLALPLDRRPDAIVCATDDIGIGCLKQLLVRKVPIPESVAVVGYNGISVLNSYEPELTTIVQPVRMMADAAIQMLMDRIKGNAAREARKIVVRGELSVGNSTLAQAGGNRCREGFSPCAGS